VTEARCKQYLSFVRSFIRSPWNNEGSTISGCVCPVQKNNENACLPACLPLFRILIIESLVSLSLSLSLYSLRDKGTQCNSLLRSFVRSFAWNKRYFALKNKFEFTYSLHSLTQSSCLALPCLAFPLSCLSVHIFP
jgi:hypothetical protein